MNDSFLNLARPKTPAVLSKRAGVPHHTERAHSKYSASGAERWVSCPGSVALSEGIPDRPSVWSREGTHAHEVLEAVMRILLAGGEISRSVELYPVLRHPDTTRTMVSLAKDAARFILGLHARTPGSDVLVETRIYLSFIHPEMFGTFDGAVIDHWGTLHVFDYKYGAGHFVSPTRNLQMIFYGLGLAHLHHWNFRNVRLWIIQPRVSGYDGPLWWELTTKELRGYVGYLGDAVRRCEEMPDTFVEGSWCHWCRARPICPLKTGKKFDRARSVFGILPLTKATAPP